MAWQVVTALPEDLAEALQDAEDDLALSGNTIDPDTLQVQSYGELISSTESETRIAVLFTSVSAATVTWNVDIQDPEQAAFGLITLNDNSLRMIHIGEKNGRRYDSKMLVLYST